MKNVNEIMADIFLNSKENENNNEISPSNATFTSFKIVLLLNRVRLYENVTFKLFKVYEYCLWKFIQTSIVLLNLLNQVGHSKSKYHIILRYI